MNSESMLNAQCQVSQKIDKEDSVLFKTHELKNLRPVYKVNGNGRNLFKCFNYRDLGKLYYKKIILRNDRVLNSLLKYREVDSYESSVQTFKHLNSTEFNFRIRGEKVGQVDEVIFSLMGENKKLQKNIFNKNFVSYYLPVSTFSLRYGEDAPTDIFFGGKEALFALRIKYPLMISFYKKQKSLYVMMLIPKENKMNLDGALFGKIMNDNSDLLSNETVYSKNLSYDCQ